MISTKSQVNLSAKSVDAYIIKPVKKKILISIIEQKIGK